MGILQWIRPHVELHPRYMEPPSPSPAPLIIYVASDSLTAQNELADSVPPNTRAFSLAAPANDKVSGYVQCEFDMLGLDEMVHQTRGMSVDFAMISDMWGSLPGRDDILSVCRLSAVGSGWKRTSGTQQQVLVLFISMQGYEHHLSHYLGTNSHHSSFLYR